MTTENRIHPGTTYGIGGHITNFLWPCWWHGVTIVTQETTSCNRWNMTAEGVFSSWQNLTTKPSRIDTFAIGKYWSHGTRPQGQSSNANRLVTYANSTNQALNVASESTQAAHNPTFYFVKHCSSLDSSERYTHEDPKAAWFEEDDEKPRDNRDSKRKGTTNSRPSNRGNEDPSSMLRGM